ncbi:endonuclease/exonuclease/phosphatase family protein [Pseudoroseomonas globiformis]|uniref:Endonuclease/exonuclease/phosphatase family protein n=1 Tax=Teichococcus globiformis TaxID=2307229 RepID=A0ABV7FZU2_9PROT
MFDIATTPLTGCFSQQVSALTTIGAEAMARLRSLPADRAAHDAAMGALAAFRQVEMGGQVARPAPPGPLTIAAWNLERCAWPEPSAALLAAQGVSLALLSEVDNGLHRTHQRHTTAEMAAMLGHAHGYAVEFLELAIMPPLVACPDNPPDHLRGFHGNGFTTALPCRDPFVIRFPDESDWYLDAKPGQRRIGNRMAVAATFTHEGQDFVGCAVHLESRADFAGRARQMAFLLDAIEARRSGLPVVVGGDLNTAVEAVGGLDDPRETLFAGAEARGYDWRACNLAAPTTRPSGWSGGCGTRQLDWFCTRGFEAGAARIVPSVAPDGTVLSDHDMILVTLTFPPSA